MRPGLPALRLREGRESIAGVAFDVGYDSEAAFSRAFKARVRHIAGSVAEGVNRPLCRRAASGIELATVAQKPAGTISFMAGTSSSVAIIVNWNQHLRLKDSLPRVLEQTLPFDRVIVVDNGSRDGSIAFCRTFPGVEVVELQRNLGFAGGVNEGLRRALASPDLDLIALVNNDVQLDIRWHAEAVDALTSRPSYGSVATCLLKADRPDVVDTAGIMWSQPGCVDNYLTGRPAPVSSAGQEDIFGACAGAALYRRSFFETVGLFDESLFAYQEDVDLALRGRAAGWRCVFAPAARGWHVGFGTNSNFPLGGSYADFYNARNRISVLIQSLPADEWRAHWLRIFAGELQRAARSLTEGRGLSVVAGLGHGLWWTPFRIRRRRQESRLRRLTPGLAGQRPSEPGWSSVSVAVITRNAARVLPGALVSVPIEAELLVADDRSHDGTARLAAAAGARVVSQDRDVLAAAHGNFDVARNQLTGIATRDWMLFLDADERITPELRAEVPVLLSTASGVVAYDLPRENHFWNRPVRLLGEDRQVRLIRRGYGRYVGQSLHRPPVIDGTRGHARAALLHQNVTRWGDILDRFRRYLPVEARTRSGPPTLLAAVLIPWRSFHYYYIRQQAWRDGFRGFVVTVLYASYETMSEWAAGVRRRV